MMWPFSQSLTPQELLSRLQDPDAVVRRKAFQGLVDHNDPETDLLLIAALRTDPGPADLILILDIVGRRGMEEAVEAIHPHLDHEDKEVRNAAIKALVRIPTQATLDVLLPLLVDSDASVRREVRESILRVFGEKSMGAILRAIPADKTSNYYFELVSLFDEMGFFETLKESFSHQDEEVKKFHFQNLLKFHRPDFIPLYIQLAETGNASLQTQIRQALEDYSPEELLPQFQSALRSETPNRNLLKLVEDCLFVRFPHAKEELLSLTQRIVRNEVRHDLVNKVLKKPDTLVFLPALALLEDPYPPIRQLAFDTLSSLYKSTLKRVQDPSEQNRAFLQQTLIRWREKTREVLGIVGSREALPFLIRLAFSMVDGQTIDFLIPTLGKILEEAPADALKSLMLLEPSLRRKLLEGALKKDPEIAGFLIGRLNKQPSPEIAKTLLSSLPSLDADQREAFQKHLQKKAGAYKLQDMMSEQDPSIRTAILDILDSTNFDGLNAVLSRSVTDPEPSVRRKALEIAVSHKHPQIAKFLEDSAGDPDPSVALTALRALREAIPENRLGSLLAKAVKSPSEELREFALKEIARITQKRYLENFNTLPRHVRKLAGTAIQKLDSSFAETLLADLKSLDTDTRLRAALIFENLQVGGKTREGLLAAMKDPSSKVRAAVVKSLGVLGDRTLLGQLIEFLNDPDERVRANTIEAVAGAGSHDAANILLPFLEDKNNRIRANAIYAVWKIAQLNVIPVLSRMLASKDSGMKASALWVLGEMQLPDHLNLILPLLGDRNDLVRLNALKAAAKIKPDVLKPVLPQLRRDSNPEIKKLVAELSFKII